VARVLGREYGIAVYVLDFLKGFIPTLIAVKLYGADSWITTLVGLAAVLGHMFSIFLGFRGGKGVATASGVLFAINPLLGILVLTVWAIVFKLTGYVSLGSISAALAAIYLAGMMHLPLNLLFLITIVAVLVIAKHKPNVERLSEGKELKV
jgi:glycerol-3-phosphate acyltransferase PlsY